MHARLVMFTLGPGSRSRAEQTADQFASALRGLRGFQSVTFFADDTVGEYGALSLWESKEDIEAAAAALDPRLNEALSGIVKGPPIFRLFEVYEPKA